MMQQYYLIIVAISIIVVIRYVGIQSVSNRSKQIISGITMLSFVIPPFLPMGHIVGMILQVGVSAYVFVYMQTAGTP
jgi:hypothetical protein